jgi:dihydrodipicolinate reductase
MPVAHMPFLAGLALDAERMRVTRIGIYGSLGRMGQAIVAAMPALNATHAGGVDAGEDAAPLAGESDVLVDFSAPPRLPRIWRRRVRRARRSSSAPPACRAIITR